MFWLPDATKAVSSNYSRFIHMFVGSEACNISGAEYDVTSGVMILQPRLYTHDSSLMNGMKVGAERNS
jgi:hypothetical protein